MEEKMDCKLYWYPKLYKLKLLLFHKKLWELLWSLDLVYNASSKYMDIITWMLHQIFMFFNKVNLAAGLNNDKPVPF